MNRAMNRDSGVTITTTIAIFQLIENRKNSVPRIVTIPVKS